MPFVLIGIVVLGAAGVVALLMQRSSSDDKPATGGGGPVLGASVNVQKTMALSSVRGRSTAGPVLGATVRGADPVSSPTADFQTTSAAEMPSNTVAAARANELPDRFMSSSAATTAPIGFNRPEDPFILEDELPAASRSLGYSVDDFPAAAAISSPFIDDIEFPSDVAFAPGTFAGGLVDELLK